MNKIPKFDQKNKLETNPAWSAFSKFWKFNVLKTSSS